MRRSIAVVASVAALGLAGPSAATAEKPLNYGNCVSAVAVTGPFGGDVTAFTERFGPLNTNAARPNQADPILIGCL